MGYKFPSQEWVLEYQKAINSNKDYEKSARNWIYGVIVLVIEKDPSIGLNNDTYLWLDLDQGKCHEAKFVTKEEAEKAPFIIEGSYQRWKQVIRKELEPIKGILQGKLKLKKGNLPVIVRFVEAARQLVYSSTMIDTEFLDE